MNNVVHTAFATDFGREIDTKYVKQKLLFMSKVELMGTDAPPFWWRSSKLVICAGRAPYSDIYIAICFD